MALVPVRSDLTEDIRHATCTNCRSIAFEQIFSLRDIRKHKGGIFVHDLSYSAVPTCAVCQLLTKMKSTHSDHSTKHNWRLVARSAAQRFSQHLPDTTILTVDPRPNIPTSRTTCFLLSTNGVDCLSGRLLSNTVDWEIVKTWMATCKTHHSKHCGRTDFSQIPGFRVIDCKTRMIVTVDSSHVEYVTLSYVWGQGNDERTSGNELPNELPRTIDDSIRVVNFLGYHYLWVDRYCIPQDNIAEKTKLIDCMGLIYENSAFTIIATAGEDPTYGLPGAGSTSRTPQSYVQVGAQFVTMFSTTAIEEITTSKWNTRGWTYQEALLSRRKLVFSEQGVIFQCGAMHCIEDLSVPTLSLHTKNLQQYRADFDMPKPFPSRGVGERPVELFDRISEYCRRDLTYEDDVGRAFQGVYQKFMRMKYPVAQFHGIPLFAPEYFQPERHSITDRFFHGFAWTIFGPAARRHGLPSWTWMGWKLEQKSALRLSLPGRRTTSGRQLEFGSYDAITLLSVEYIDRKVVPWAQVQQGIVQNTGADYPPVNLRLVGMLFDIELSKDGDSYVNHSWPSQGWDGFPRPEHVQFHFKKKKNFKVPCLVVMQTHTVVVVLLLVEVEEGRYERVGSSSLYWWSSAYGGLSTTSQIETIEGIALRREQIRLG